MYSFSMEGFRKLFRLWAVDTKSTGDWSAYEVARGLQEGSLDEPRFTSAAGDRRGFSLGGSFYDIAAYLMDGLVP